MTVHLNELSRWFLHLWAGGDAITSAFDEPCHRRRRGDRYSPELITRKAIPAWNSAASHRPSLGTQAVIVKNR